MIVKLFISALGYLIVASFCGLAGYYSNPEKNTGELILLFLFIAFLLPVYLNRAVLYERKKHHSEGNGYYLPETKVVWSMSIDLPALMFVFACILSAIVLFGTRLDLPGYETNILMYYLKLFIAIIPGYVIGFWNNIGWQRDKRVYYFRYRSLFPAIATCILPFIYSWSEPGALYEISIASFAVLFLWFISLRLNLLVFSVFVLIVLFLLIVFSVFIKVHNFGFTDSFVSFIQVFSFGVLMTLVMGVSESWRVSTRMRDDVEYGPPGVYDIKDQNIYMSGANLAAALFFPLFFLTSLHPSTKILYLFCSVVLLSFQYYIWFRYSSKWTHVVWSTLGIIFGLSLPVVILIGTNLNLGGPLPKESLGIPAFFDLGVPVGLFIGYIAYVSGWLKIPLFARLFPKIDYMHFLDIKPSIALTGLNAIFMLFIVSLLPPVIDKNILTMGDVGMFFMERARLLQVIYFIIIIVCAFVLFLISNSSELGDEKEKKVTINPSGPICMQMKMLIISGRPVTSMIVALFSWMIIVFNSEYDPIYAFFRVVPIFLVTGVGFIVNDCFDFDKDRYSGKKRPIVCGMLDIAYAKRAALILSFLIMMWELLFANVSSLLIILITLIGVFLYSPFSHKYPVLKGFWTSLLTCSPMLYAGSVVGVVIPYHLFILLSIFVVGRELLMDVKDFNSDKLFGLKTVPYYFGVKKSVYFASFLMTTSVLYMCCINISLFSILFSVFGFVFVIYSVFIFYSDMEKSFLFSRISLLFLSISAALSV